MKRQLLFVHGRAQGRRDAAALKAEWIKAWEVGLAKSGLPIPIPEGDIRFPYYGQTLTDLVEGATDATEVIVRGQGADDDCQEFMVSILEEIRVQAGLTDRQIREEIGAAVIERGPLGWAWIHGILSALDRHVPGASGLSIALAAHDVYHYLHNPGVRDEIESGVRDAVTAGRETVVVGHSLGSVVSYSLLRRDARSLGWRIPLYVTVGSPLALTAIRRALRPLSFPASVDHWLNALDRRDVVSINPLDEAHAWLPGIENRTDVRNETSNHHGISGYLGDADVARRLHEALMAP